MKYQHCVLLPFALILVGAGLATLLLFGIRNLESYTHTKDFRVAKCMITYTNVTGDPVYCIQKDKSKPKRVVHTSAFPCLTVQVNYTEEKVQMDPYGYEINEEDSDVLERDVNDTNLVSYDVLVNSSDLKTSKSSPKKYVTRHQLLVFYGYSSWVKQHSGNSNSTCSYFVCDEEYEQNERDVESIQEELGEVGMQFKCFFNPRNHSEVYAHMISGNTLLHALVWPALGISFGVFLLVVVAFLSCEVWICRNPNRARRRMQGQTYELASYRENLRESHQQHGWRDPDQKRTGDGNNNSRLPRLSAAADIVRKWSFRGRRSQDHTDTSRTSRSFGGVPSRQWSISKADTHFCTT